MRKAFFLLFLLASGLLWADQGFGIDYTLSFEWQPKSSWGVGGGIIAGIGTEPDSGPRVISGPIVEVLYFDGNIWSTRMGLALLILSKRWMGTSGLSVVGSYYGNSPAPLGIDLNLTLVNVSLLLSARGVPNSNLAFQGVGFGFKM